MSPTDAVIVRRKLQPIVTCLEHLRPIAELGGDLPADDRGGFLSLGRLGLISNELALELAPSAGLRNRLAHEYEGVDDMKVFASIESLLRLYPRYVSAVEAYIERQGL